MNCRTDSKTHEAFQDLSLDIPDRLQRRTKDQEEVCSLTYSLTRFFKVEELADSELYFCDNCMGKQRSTKRFWIHRLPNVSFNNSIGYVHNWRQLLMKILNSF